MDVPLKAKQEAVWSKGVTQWRSHVKHTLAPSRIAAL